MGFKSIKLKFFILCLFFSEILYLFWTVDVLPFILIALGCAGCLIYNYFSVYKGEDTVEMSDLLHTSTLKENIVYICIFIFSILLLTLIVLFGGELLGSIILSLINDSKLLRFFMYGVFFPNLFSYIVTWTYTDIKPVSPENISIFVKILFVSIFVGLLICINWEVYSLIMIHF